MKRLIAIIMLTMVAMVGCKKDEPIKPNKEFDYEKVIIVRGEERGEKGYVPGLTPLEIVEQAEGLVLKSIYNDYNNEVSSYPVARNMGLEKEKNYEIPAIVLGVEFIINQDVGYHKLFTHATDVSIIDINNDTIAIIPNSVMRYTQVLIEEAWDRQDFDEMYRVFEDEYKFVPVE